MKKNVLFLLSLIAFSSLELKGQSFQDAYNMFKQQAEQDYEEFRRKVNQEYADWMRKSWEWHDKIEPMPMPKDEMLPPIIYNKEEKHKESKPLPFEVVNPQPKPTTQPKPIAPIKEDIGTYRLLSFRFYGTEGQVRLPEKLFKVTSPDPSCRRGTGSNGNNECTFAAAWEELSSGDYDNLIRDCLVLRMEHQLCDWAYLQMVVTMSHAAYGKGTNEAVMLQGFVLCQSGYKIRFGYADNNKLLLLFKCDHLIFNKDVVEMDDGIYYFLEPFEGEGLNVCDVSYPEEQPFSLLITQKQYFSIQPSRERLFIPADSLMAVKVQSNKNLIEFYDDYPCSVFGEDIMTKWATYANTPLTDDIKQQLYPQLMAVINQLNNKVVAADWLLYWVQTSFVYEYDDKVWGHDRSFFAEETLYYPYCDCEDRSILYSRLIRDLLGLDVLLVFYPGHLATAVDFNVPVEGDFIEMDNKYYIICDPTYIGAPIGVTMPDMDNQTAKVILLQ
jgi:hypothetical protein